MAYLIKCGQLYWKDVTPNDGWCWTHNESRAKRFEDAAVVDKIIEYWEKVHHDEQTVKGKTIQQTSLGSILPLGAVKVQIEP